MLYIVLQYTSMEVKYTLYTCSTWHLGVCRVCGPQSIPTILRNKFTVLEVEFLRCMHEKLI